MKHLNLPYKVAFMTLGCKVNQYESERLMSKFLSAGFEIVQFNEYADVYIVNTCTVTNIADRKSRKMLHRASRMNEEALVVAMGCFAQAEGESLLLDQRIKLIIGNDKKEQAFEIITKHLNLTTNISEQEDNPKMIINERTRAYIKIQDGCNQFCSYCKIPYVRGKLRSKAQDEIVEEVELLASNGYKEVVLTGIHLSSYGVDKTKCATFVELRGEPLLGLLGRIEQVEGIERIRLGSLEPRIITDEFISGLVNIKKVCPHFHLSLQSGSDSVLERMNRKYRTKDYKNACDIIRTYYTSPAITTDIIVGFPGETIEVY